MRISRRVERLPEALAASFLRGAAAGWVFLSTSLSAGERELFALLAEHGGQMVVVKERGLGWVYRPDIHEDPLLAEGRLAVLGLVGDNGWPTASLQEATVAQQVVTRAGSLLLNDKIAAMAEASGGLAMYIDEDWPEHGSYTRFAGVVKAALWERLDLMELLKFYGTAPPPSGTGWDAKTPCLAGFERFCARSMGQQRA